MTDKRDISTPTSFSSCLSGNYILIKDLAGRSHIFSKEEKEAIGAKIVELTQDDELPTFEVGKVTISDDSPTVNSFADLNLDDLDPDNIKKVVIQQGLGWLQGLTSYPRGRSVPPKKKK